MGFFQEHADVLRCGLVHAVEDAFEVALNNMQGRAQVVGHVCGEVAPVV